MSAVIVTGAAGGIGQALCATFRKAGYRVVGIDIKPAAGCDAFVELDLAKFASDERYRDEAATKVRAAIGGAGVHALVNNAAVQILAPADQVEQTDWDRTLAVNLSAPFFLAQALLPEIERARGCVINIASIHATLTKPRFVAYATSKAALVGLTRAMAVDLSGRVRVNAIAPAAIETPMLREGFRGNERAFDALASAHPAGRVGTPEEVAATAVFLASDASRFLNGATVDVGGGIHGRLHDPE